MLMSAVHRIRRINPSTRILVPSASPQLLSSLIPDIEPVDVRPYSWGSEGVFGRAAGRAFSWARPGCELDRYINTVGLRSPHPLSRAISDSDAVIAAGGGYICDAFPVHAKRVVGLLDAALSAGKPVAMFGQGLGPFEDEVLQTRVAELAARVQALGLRVPHDEYNDSRNGTVTLTGDDALAVVGEFSDSEVAVRDAVGANLRLARYNGADATSLDQLGRQIRRFADAEGLRVQSLPIDILDELDARSTHRAVFGTVSASEAPNTIEGLIAAARSCRVAVTMSYHAAVFSLAVGVPVVAVTKSAYYDGKFNGLKALYGSSVYVIHLNDAQDNELHAALAELDAARAELGSSALRQSEALVARGNDLYAEFFASID